jgi:hypothetical protein
MGEVWDCYRYSGDEPATRTSRGRLIPPADEPGDWRLAHFAPFRLHIHTDVAAALAWLEEAIHETLTDLRALGIRHTPDLLDLIRGAADGLTRAPYAWQWPVTYPDGHRKVLAILRRWESATEAAERANQTQAASPGPGQLARRPEGPPEPPVRHRRSRPPRPTTE